MGKLCFVYNFVMEYTKNKQIKDAHMYVQKMQICNGICKMQKIAMQNVSY